MSLLGLSLAYIRARALNAALNLVLLALGVGTIVLLLLFSAAARGAPDPRCPRHRPRDRRQGQPAAADPRQHLPRRLSDRQHPARRGRALGAPSAGGGGDPAGARRQPRGLSDRRHRARLCRALWRRAGRRPALAGAVRGDARRAGRRRGPGSRSATASSAATASPPAAPPTASTPTPWSAILAPSASVLDRVVLTPIESVWLAHGMEPHEEHDEGGPRRAPRTRHDGTRD